MRLWADLMSHADAALLFYFCYWRKRGARRSRILQPAHHKKGYPSNHSGNGALQEWELDLSNVQ